MDEFAEMEIGMPLISKTAIKVAIYLWYHVDVSEYMEFKDKKLKQVLINTTTLPLPNLLQRQVLNVVEPIGVYLRKALISLHCTIVSPLSTDTRWPVVMNWPKLLCWRNIGVLDNKRTAEKILSSGILETFSAFRLACFNCIENEILKLGSDSRQRVHRHFDHLFDHESLPVIFWICCIQRKTEQMLAALPDTLNVLVTTVRSHPQIENTSLTAAEFGFICGIIGENVEFCKYHARGLEDSKLNFLMLMAAKQFLNQDIVAFPSDAFRLVFSRLNFTQKVEIFAEKPFRKILYLLSWPLQDFFLDIAIQLCDSLSESEFIIILFQIFYLTGTYKYSEVFQHIFKNFWENSSLRHRSFFLVEWIYLKLFEEAFCSRVFEGRLGKVKLDIMFIELLKYNGLIVLEVLMGHCYLDILVHVFKHYMLTETFEIHPNFRRTIEELRCNHMCGKMCSPNRFDDYIMILNFCSLLNSH